MFERDPATTRNAARFASVFLLAVCSVPGPLQASAQAQDAEPPPSRARNQFGIGWGYRSTQVQDLLFSPLIYEGQGALVAELFYRRQSDTGVLFVQVGFDRTSVESVDQLTFPVFGPRRASTASLFNLRLGYARELLETGSFDLLLGGMLDNQIHILEYRFAEVEDEGYLIAYSLAIWATGRYRIDRRQAITGQVSYPVASFLSRPPFAIVDNESIQSSVSGFGQIHSRGEWQAFGGFVKWHFLVRYARELSSRFDLELSYRFDYMRASDPQQLAILRNGLNVAIVLGT